VLPALKGPHIEVSQILGSEGVGGRAAGPQSFTPFWAQAIDQPANKGGNAQPIGLVLLAFDKGTQQTYWEERQEADEGRD
jgi:hypothetical protein